MKLHSNPSIISLESLIVRFEGEVSSSRQSYAHHDSDQDAGECEHTTNPAPTPSFSPDPSIDPAGTSFYSMLDLSSVFLSQRNFDLAFTTLQMAATFPDMPPGGLEVLLQRIDEWLMVRRAIPSEAPTRALNDYHLINQRRENEEELRPAWNLRAEISDRLDKANRKIAPLHISGKPADIPHPISFSPGEYPREYQLLFEHLEYRMNENAEISKRHTAEKSMRHLLLSYIEEDFLKISTFLDSQGKQQPGDGAAQGRHNKIYAYAYLLHARLCEQRILYWEEKFPPGCPRVGSVWTSIQNAIRLNPDLKTEPWVRFYNEGQPAGTPFYKKGDFKFLAWVAGMGALGYFSVTNGIHSTHPEIIAAIGVPYTLLTILYGRRSIPAFPDLKRAFKKEYLIPVIPDELQHPITPHS